MKFNQELLKAIQGSEFVVIDNSKNRDSKNDMGKVYNQAMRDLLAFTNPMSNLQGTEPYYILVNGRIFMCENDYEYCPKPHKLFTNQDIYILEQIEEC